MQVPSHIYLVKNLIIETFKKGNYIMRINRLKRIALACTMGLCSQTLLGMDNTNLYEALNQQNINRQQYVQPHQPQPFNSFQSNFVPAGPKFERELVGNTQDQEDHFLSVPWDVKREIFKTVSVSNLK